MKVLAFFIDIVVLAGLTGLMIAIVGDGYLTAGILTKALLMGAVGGVFGLLRPLYHNRLLPPEEKEAEG